MAEPIVNEKQERKWEIYTLSDPRNGEVRYVGITHCGVGHRVINHISEATRGKKSHKCNWIRQLLSLELKPIQTVIEEGLGSGWSDAERRQIALHRDSGASLVNLTAGGDGCLLPFDQRSAASKKLWANRTPEERSAVGRAIGAGWSKISPEARRALGIKREARVTAEQRSARIQKALMAYTTERRSAAMRKVAASKTPEERSAILKKANAQRTPEERSRIGRFRSSMTPEQRKASARKGISKSTYEQRVARMTFEQRSAASIKGYAGTTPDDRSAVARTRWANMTPESRAAFLGSLRSKKPKAVAGIL